MQKNKLVEAVAEASKLPKEKQEEFFLERLKENTPSDAFVEAMLDQLATVRRRAFVAYIKAGFSEEQALVLCQSK